MMKHALRHAGIWARTLHIYASMAGFLLVLLFAVTGITLNHQDSGWGEPVTSATTVTLPLTIVKTADTVSVQEALQSILHITTPASSYQAYAEEIDVAFHSPGRRVHAIVNRADGSVKVVTETRGSIGIINDLHKGMETGAVWRWIVDATAILIGFSAISGIVTLVSLPKRRLPGLLTTAAGAVVVLAIYWWFVPR
jgi:uncharacterized protein